MNERLRIATRGSDLARAQSLWVGRRLEKLGREVELVIIRTRGDRIQDRPLAAIGGKGLFVKEVELAVLEGRADLAVHSMKDMPADCPDGLVFAAVPRREDPRDCLVSRRGWTLEELPRGAVVGTSSLRRRAHLLALRPDLEIRDLRGNVQTRLDHLRADGPTGRFGDGDGASGDGHGDGLAKGPVDAVILARAGLNRLGLRLEGAVDLDPQLFVPAAGQGALAVQARRDSATAALLRALDDAETALAVEAERAFLATLGGSCHVPCGALARLEDGKMVVEGFLAPASGSPALRVRRQGDRSAAASLGRLVAEEILNAGGRAIMAALGEGAGR